MYQFSYHKPESIEEAKRLFASADDAMYLAGGHTLIPSMKQRLSAPSDLIDLSGIAQLSDILVEPSQVTIGALTKHDDVATSDAIASVIPALTHLAGGIGDAQVRNRGTIGGSVANSDPAADYPAAVLGLGAEVITDARVIPADSFFNGMFETALEEGEMITAIRFPVPDCAAYAKFPNPASRYATVGVFVARTGDAVRVAITGAGPCVFRSPEIEAALQSDFSVSAVEQVKIEADDLLSDLHASAEYRANLCTVMAKRAISQLV